LASLHAIALPIVTCFVAIVSYASAGQDSASPAAPEEASAELLDRWKQCVRDLNHDTFAQREEATKMLIRAGRGATGLVVEAFQHGNPEARFRALYVLRANVWSKDPDAADAARSALRQLASSNNVDDAKAAAEVLHTLATAAERQLQHSGARLSRDSQGKVVKVNFAQTKIGDEALRPLVELRPTELDLRFTQVTDQGLEFLRGQTQLEVLNLQATGVTDAGMQHLAGLRRLRSLSVERTAVTDAGLVHFKEFGQLKILFLGGSKIVGPGLAHVEKLPVEYLSFFGSPVDDSVVKHVLRLRNLKSLGFDKTRVTDAGVEPLVALKHLEVLWLDSCPVTDKCVGDLKRLSGLKRLSLTNTALTKTAVAGLQATLKDTDINFSQ